MQSTNSTIVDVMADLRTRVRKDVSVALSDRDALTIALMCGTTEARGLLEYAQEGTVKHDSLTSMPRLALSDDAFVALFGTFDPLAASRLQRGATQKPLMDFERLDETRRMRARLEAALVTTLAESAQLAAWKASPRIRVAAQIALCREGDPIRCLDAVVGGMVLADQRRVDDLKTAVEEDSIDLMIMSQAIVALAGTVA